MTYVCTGGGHWSVACNGAGVGISQVKRPWNSIVNLCCFDGRVFYSTSVDTEKQMIPAHYSIQMKCDCMSKQTAEMHIQSARQQSGWGSKFAGIVTEKGPVWNLQQSTRNLLHAVYKVSILLRCIKTGAARQTAAQQTALCRSVWRRNTPLVTFTQLKAIHQSVMFSALQDKVL